MKDRQRRWARLLPDHRTLYASLEELDAHRFIGESDADLLMRSISFAHGISAADDARQLAGELADRVGLPREDPLALELALALVVRSRFLAEHPHLLQVTVDEQGDGNAILAPETP